MGNTVAAPAPADDNEPPKPAVNALAVRSASTGLTMYDRITDPMVFIKNIGDTLFDSKMFGCANIAQGRALALGFITNKLDPFSWKARHHIIKGNITMSAEAMLADFRTSGGDHTIISRTPEKAAVELRHGRKKALFEFTWAEAQNEDYAYTQDANLGKVDKRLPDGSVNPAALKDNWSTPRRRGQMLWARVISDAVGAMMPEVSAGRQTPEELGVLGNEIQSQVIEEAVEDAEFTVSTASNAPPANPSNAAADDATLPPVTSRGVSAASTTPAPAEELVRPEASAAATPVSSVVQPPASGPAQSKTQADGEKLMALAELKRLKDALDISKEKWTGILQKRNVPSARDLDMPRLHQLIDDLKGVVAKRNAAAGKDPVSQWANNVASGGSQKDLAATGN